ncbi:MAG: hypothetical protein LUM44_17795 [Pyrinomonadaceae bacterium]|nr:hypothetical protein [Pyrinomonadaceae bacterium]
MKKVYQTDFTNVTGNCLAACVASILECELDDVPNFVTFPNWKEEYIRFWESKNRVPVFFHSLSDDGLLRAFERLPFTGYCIVAVQSFLHPENLHAVVGFFENKLLKVVHDPNPANKNKTSSDYLVAEIDLFY